MVFRISPWLEGLMLEATRWIRCKPSQSRVFKTLSHLKFSALGLVRLISLNLEAHDASQPKSNSQVVQNHNYFLAVEFFRNVSTYEIWYSASRRFYLSNRKTFRTLGFRIAPPYIPTRLLTRSHFDDRSINVVAGFPTPLAFGGKDPAIGF